MAGSKATVDRIILNNLSVERQRELKRLVELANLPLRISTGAEHGHAPLAWVEIVQTAQQWTQQIPDFLQLLTGDIRSAVVGFLVAKVIESRTQQQRPTTDAQGLSKFIEGLIGENLSRVVLTVENAGVVAARYHLTEPTRDELVKAFIAMTAAADRISTEMESTTEDSRRFGWQITIQDGILEMTRCVPGEAPDKRCIIELPPELAPNRGDSSPPEPAR